MLSTLLLLVVLAGVILLFFKVRTDNQRKAIILGGPLLRVQADSITGLLLTHRGAQIRLDLVGEDTWTLSGSTEDFVDPNSMKLLLADLVGAQGGSILPGTEPEDRRYDFNGPESLRLTIFTTSHDKLTLALGTVNPVTGDYYASGLGRPGCFMVNAKLQRRLVGLPRAVELKTLLPAVTARDLDTIVLGRGTNEYRLEKRKIGWWLQVPKRGLRALGADVVAYNQLYHDRLQTDSEGTWVLASDAAVRLLVFELSKIIVREIKPAAQTADWSAKWRMSEPWRSVVFMGKGINPDPTGGDSDRLELVLGEPLGSQLIPVARRGVVLLADDQASNTLDQPLGALVSRTALGWSVLSANHLEIHQEGRLVLIGQRQGGTLEGDGRQQWKTPFPTTLPKGLSPARFAGITGEFMVELGRMKMLAPLPPVTGESPLQDRGLVEVKLSYSDSGPVAEELFQVGYLKPGIGSAAEVATGAPRVGLWHPQTGQLVQVNESLLVTVRNFALF